jgi:predicted dehydrogenase
MTDVAIIGIGDWGQNLVRAFDDLASVRAVCHTGASANARWIAEEYPEIELTTDYDAVLADDRIDAVVVATPIPSLADVAERALEAGKHVYVEKPMAATREDGERLVALAEDRDLTLFVGYVFVHHPTFTWVRDRLAEEGADVLRLSWDTEGSFGPGLVNNLACHPVSLAVAALGTPEDVSLTSHYAVTGETDVVSCRLAYGDTDCEVRVDRLSPNKRYRMTAFTDAGGAYVATDDAVYAFDKDSRAYETAFDPAAEPLGAECENFLAAVESGDRPATDGQFGLRVHDVLDEIKAGI